jgi:hypothetical protein
MKTLTIRNVPRDLDEALQVERTRRGTSLNQTVLDLLQQRLGIGVARSNGLARLAGTWSDEEFEQFQDVTGVFERVDEELWK